MTIIIPTRFALQLQDTPETGIGYQKVSITLKDGKILPNRIVLNSNYLKLEEGEDIDQDDIVSVTIAN